MAACNPLLLIILLTHVSFSTQSPSELPSSSSPSLSFSLNTLRLHHTPKVTPTTTTAAAAAAASSGKATASPSIYRARLQHMSMAMVASIPFGTPPQFLDMVLDTGSQLSWIPCHSTPTKSKKASSTEPPAAAAAAKPTLQTPSFNPSRSASFSVLPCTHPLCKPSNNPDYAVPTTCGDKHDCRYSLFYADGTFAQGNLVSDKFNTSLPVTLGCSSESDSDSGRGILGMNLGRLSFASQSKFSKFSYCVPEPASRASGSLVLGPPPKSNSNSNYKYVKLLTYGQPNRMPNCDPLAYTLPLIAIKINGLRVNVSSSAFRSSPNGSGQTILDSGTEFTYLVEEAYAAVRAEIVRAAGARLKHGYAYQGALDMCFEENDKTKVGGLVRELGFVYEGGVEVAVEKEKNVVEAARGVYCVGIGRSDSLGLASNIIGNFHQKGMWVEYDLANRKVGFSKSPDCSS